MGEDASHASQFGETSLYMGTQMDRVLNSLAPEFVPEDCVKPSAPTSSWEPLPCIFSGDKAVCTSKSPVFGVPADVQTDYATKGSGKTPIHRTVGPQTPTCSAAELPSVYVSDGGSASKVIEHSSELGEVSKSSSGPSCSSGPPQSQQPGHVEELRESFSPGELIRVQSIACRMVGKRVSLARVQWVFEQWKKDGVEGVGNEEVFAAFEAGFFDDDCQSREPGDLPDDLWDGGSVTQEEDEEQDSNVTSIAETVVDEALNPDLFRWDRKDG